jgi:protocatechuate 3,4-dioxygenase beta subunit
MFRTLAVGGLVLIVGGSIAARQGPLSTLSNAEQAEELVPPPYLGAQYLAPRDMPSKVVLVRRDEPGERLVVTGRVLDGMTPVAGVSIYVFNTDADGVYAKGMKSPDCELNPRLHGLLRTDSNGQYQYETIRPGRYRGGASHVHHVLRAPGYKARLMDLWFDDDPIVIARRKAGQPEVPDSIRNSSVCRSLPDCVAIRPVTQDADGVWHATRDFALIKE